MHNRAIISLRDLSVRFGPTVALAGLDLDFQAGSVHALVGENGAGKSTLLRVVTGVVEPTSGTVHRSAGTLAWVPQETELPNDLTVSDWIFLGDEWRGRFGLLRHRAMQRAAAAVLERLGAEVAPAARLGELPAAQRKLVQIARAVHRRPDVLLLDEPTAVLGDHETRLLFALVRQLRDSGTAVVYVSHRLEEVLELADRVTVLRDGCHVSTDAASSVDIATLVRRMVGRDIPARTAASTRRGQTLLQIDRACAGLIRALSLELCEGEIVGLAGLMGAGRSELLETVCGLRPLESGSVHCAVPPVLVPEDRASKGLIPSLNLSENIFLPAADWRLRPRRESEQTTALMQQVQIKASGPQASIAALSGGNQQKVLLARALRRSQGLLLLDEPTAGVDVGAKAEIHAIIRGLAAAGAGILLASSDLPELLAVADRILALRNGRLVGALSASQASEHELAALITGAALARPVGGTEACL